jgi:hypothetical protein
MACLLTWGSGTPYGTRPDGKKLRSKKISSAKTEVLPELSAGSDESEDLPDPTAGTYWRRRRPSTGAIPETRSERVFPPGT